MDIWSSRLWAEDARTKRSEMNERPWGIMCIAKFKWPRIDNSLRLEQVGLSNREDATRIVRSIFSFNRDAWNLLESNLMPKNSIEVLGPAFFFSAMRIPSSAKTFWTVKRCAAGIASGGDMIWKSTSRWIRCGILWLLERIQHIGYILTACRKLLGYFCNRRLGGWKNNNFFAREFRKGAWNQDGWAWF